MKPSTTYIYISLKHTHPKDQWFCLWRPDERGYTFFYQEAGKYFKPYATSIEPNVLSVPIQKIMPYIREVMYEGKKRIIVPNTAETRQAFAIIQDDLLEKNPYKFSKT